MATRRGNVLSIESTSVQDYVKVLYTSTEWHGGAITASHLATRLSVANSSVTGMVAKLVELGLADHRKYGPISLTPAGLRLALAMVRRHRLIETFLVRELGYGWDEVHDEAELLEHSVSAAFIERLAAKLDHPSRDPHGDPIPTREGTVHYPAALRLDSLDEGHTGTLARVSDDDPGVLRFLDRHGIALDDELLLGRRGAGSALELHVGAATTPLPIDGMLAAALWIESSTPHPGCTVEDGRAERGSISPTRVADASAPRLSP
ncbi:metal-dependent transcriptional regulator [Arthrobacter echini]|uniref:Manganese transport regulator n=2 Tax=Arthrobacter echini TaxID=1529066 RepID=A0A4S5E4A9_9MICC|nr:metal-dependent transcriptional regulator [Arthrobacter echini]